MDITPDVKAHNPSDIPCQDTDFYKWITQTGYKQFRGLSVLYYMEDRYSYRIGRDVLSVEARTALCHIYDYYTHTVMHPIWGAERTND